MKESSRMRGDGGFADHSTDSQGYGRRRKSNLIQGGVGEYEQQERTTKSPNPDMCANKWGG